MDIDGYLFASGLALLIVLLGWADQLTSRNKETKDLEAHFLNAVKLQKKKYKRITKKGGSSEESFLDLIDFLFKSSQENLELFTIIQRIKDELGSLDRKYDNRFWILVSLSIVLFLSGIVSMFTSSEKKLFLLFPSLPLIALVFYNLIDVHNLEKRYTKALSDAMEKL